jgi:hypothetical protein
MSAGRRSSIDTAMEEGVIQVSLSISRFGAAYGAVTSSRHAGHRGQRA